MTNEIKEILDICVLEGELTIDYIDKSGIKKEYEDISDEALSDYITNLQEENKRSKEIIKILNNEIEAYVKHLGYEIYKNKKLQERIQ